MAHRSQQQALETPTTTGPDDDEVICGRVAHERRDPAAKFNHLLDIETFEVAADRGQCCVRELVRRALEGFSTSYVERQNLTMRMNILWVPKTRRGR